MSARTERIQALLWEQSGERTPAQFFNDVAEMLCAEKFPLWRMAGALIAHDPYLTGTTLFWDRENGTIEKERPHEILKTDLYLGSPAEYVLREGKPLRLVLDDAAIARFPLLADVRAQGGTDYLALPLPVADGLTYANQRFASRIWFSCATNVPGGFSSEDVADLVALIKPLGLRCALEATKQTARSLLRAYLGANAATLVLAGEFRRGGARTIRAVIWYCDMRGFTSMSDDRQPGEVVAILDRYFDATATPVLAHGGEVLKFIGDAVLAIFPLDGDGGARGACERALAATREAIAALDALSAELRPTGGPELGLGAALHVGEVAYGNIGASTRLDFTVIGAAVNEVCRIEPLTRTLGEPALLSKAFVETAAIEARSLGKHALKGVSEPQEVFALPWINQPPVA